MMKTIVKSFALGLGFLTAVMAVCALGGLLCSVMGVG